VVPYQKLGASARSAVRGYVAELARHSRFFHDALNGASTVGRADP
jgi:hypothetical protein